MHSQLLTLKYYLPDGEFITEAQHETEFTDIQNIRQELAIRRRRAELPGTRLTEINIYFETPRKESGLVPLDSSNGVSFGDNAKENITITGRVSGDINLGKRR